MKVNDAMVDANELAKLLHDTGACREARDRYAGLTISQALNRAEREDLVWFARSVLGVRVRPCYTIQCPICAEDGWAINLSARSLRRYIREALAL